MHLRPYADRPDDELPTVDLRVYKQIGEAAPSSPAIRRFPCSTTSSTTRRTSITGAADDWAYDHLGVFALDDRVLEPAAPGRVQGLPPHRLDRTIPSTTTSRCCVVRRAARRRGFVDWYEFDHPQLGRSSSAAGTPPTGPEPSAAPLEAEVAPHADWAIWHVLVSPALGLHSLTSSRSARPATPACGWSCRTQVVADERHPEGGRAQGGEADGSSSSCPKAHDSSAVSSRPRRVKAGRAKHDEERSTTWWANDESTPATSRSSNGSSRRRREQSSASRRDIRAPAPCASGITLE